MNNCRSHCVELLPRVGWCVAMLLTLIFTHGDIKLLAPAVIAWATVIAVGLAITGRARRWILPFFLLTVLLIFCYDSAAVFAGYARFAPLILVPLAVYFIRLRPEFIRGVTFWPLCAVAVATLAAGLFTITAAEYFRPAALYHVLALGPGMVIGYLYFKNELKGEEAERSFLVDLVTWGIAAALVVYGYRIWHISEWVELWKPPEIQWSNNIGTMLMICMPAVFACARKHYPWMLAGFLVYGATLLTWSRGAIIFATLELICCLLWLFLAEKRPIHRLWNRTFLLYALGAAAVMFFTLAAYGEHFGFFRAQEGRALLLRRGFEDLFSSPIFGTGFGYLGNADLYSSKEGAINWYHVFPAQIMGGMGLCGILAWGYQLLVRVRLAVRLRRSDSFVLPLCYLGLLLMSMVNPGEFCPLPYGAVAVALFVLAENAAERGTGSLGQT